MPPPAGRSPRRSGPRRWRRRRAISWRLLLRLDEGDEMPVDRLEAGADGAQLLVDLRDGVEDGGLGDDHPEGADDPLEVTAVARAEVAKHAGDGDHVPGNDEQQRRRRQEGEAQHQPWQTQTLLIRIVWTLPARRHLL